MKRGGGHLRTEECLVLGFFELEEGQRAAVADPEKTMTRGSHGAEALSDLHQVAISGKPSKSS